MMTNLVECRDLRLGYGPNAMCSCPDFTVGAGDYLVIADPNGTGKTTLLKCIAGLLKPLSGTLARAPGLASGVQDDHIQLCWADDAFLFEIPKRLRDIPGMTYVDKGSVESFQLPNEEGDQ